jgi:hypothetical protein
MLVTNALLMRLVGERGGRPDLAHPDPGTHAQLMGVGKYPHLIGGDGPSSADATACSNSVHPNPAREIAD